MPRLLVVLGSVALEKAGTPYFHRYDGGLLAALCERGHDVVATAVAVGPSDALASRLYVCDTPVAAPRFSFVGLPAPRRAPATIASKLGVWARSAARLWPLLRGGHAQIVFMPSPQGFLALVLGWLRGAHSVVFYAGDWGADLSIEEPQSGFARVQRTVIRWIRARLQDVAYRIASVILMCDPSICRKLAALRPQVYLAAAFTSHTPLVAFDRPDTCGGNRVLCLSVGTLAQFKGVRDVLQAMCRLRQGGHPVEWWHAGEAAPGFAATVKRLVQELGLEEHVRLLGYLDHDALLAVYHQADVFVHASHTEGLPRVLSEAMGQGLPVVTTRVGGIGLVLEHEQSALLVEPRNPPAIAEAVARLITDAGLRRRLIANGRQWALGELARDPVEQILSVLPAGK